MTYINENGKYQFQTQTDYRWANELMGTKYEKFHDYGCLITALTNIINIKKSWCVTVKDVINVIRKEKLFAGDRYPNTPENQKSFLLTDEFLKYYGLKRQEVGSYIDGKTHYCRVQVKMKNGGTIGHFTNIFKFENKLFIFDVFDGSFVQIQESAITNYYIVEAI